MSRTSCYQKGGDVYHGGQPRRKNSKNADAYRDLPETFPIKEVMAVLDLEDCAARQQCNRWAKHGFVERIKQGRYKKIMKEIMV